MQRRVVREKLQRERHSVKDGDKIGALPESRFSLEIMLSSINDELVFAGWYYSCIWLNGRKTGKCPQGDRMNLIWTTILAFAAPTGLTDYRFPFSPR